MKKTNDVESTPDFVLDGMHHKILVAFRTYYYLTAMQVTKLFYSQGSFTTAKARLKALVDNGYLLALPLPTTKAKSPYVYTLSTLGREYVSGLGLEITGASFRPINEREKTYGFFTHCLATSDFLIAAQTLERAVPGVQIDTIYHDLYLKHHPPLIPASAGSKEKKVIPDGWLKITVASEDGKDEHTTCIWLELDRGTEEVIAIKSKIKDLVTLHKSGGYKARFETNSVIFAFATYSDRRVETLRKWIREALHAVKADTYYLRMFAITNLSLEPSPQELFFTPTWLMPSEHSKPVALLKRN